MNLQSFLMMLSRNCSLRNRPNSTYESIYRSIWNYAAILFDDQPKMFLQMKSNIDSDVRTKTLCIQFFLFELLLLKADVRKYGVHIFCAFIGKKIYE